MPNLIDQETLESLRELQSDEDPNFLKNYFTLFLKPIPTLLNNINKSIEDSDFAELAMSAHALKSSSSNSGVLAISKICADLEKLGHEKSIAGARPMLDQLKIYIEQLEVEIRSLPEFKP